ncbi:DUF2939 domain-containing protein [Rhodopseudomonas palustris]|uniref:DUF2939 domain-containing protein n=1 Tax=Rhodopseudomonas palustris TaxID=1076 RepID=UPI002ACE9CEB|nr:DUF2939 domain-containing protein [Rhodopseudomonas palustris]WQG97443.1 DUF2939 domain-containing protein [Rhodopseudomonas palustris]
MRWFFGGLAAILIVVLIYLGSAAVSLAGLAAAARSGDGAAVIARTDVKSLTQSLADQIVGAYLDRIGQSRQVRPMERTLVRGVGIGFAEAMIAKMLTPDRLTQLLKTGGIGANDGLPSFEGVPKLADLDTGNVLSLLQRFRFIQPVEFAIRISESSEPELYSAVKVHFYGTGWKMSGLVLPEKVARDLAAALPAK